MIHVSWHVSSESATSPIAMKRAVANFLPKISNWLQLKLESNRDADVALRWRCGKWEWRVRAKGKRRCANNLQFQLDHLSDRVYHVQLYLFFCTYVLRASALCGGDDIFSINANFCEHKIVRYRTKPSIARIALVNLRKACVYLSDAMCLMSTSHYSSAP
ncbi:hypothetical protein IG631_01654 [Alternaria alternata]|nr:hypothetical protein IG631_01654 [Alternaria alternata]